MDRKEDLIYQYIKNSKESVLRELFGITVKDRLFTPGFYPIEDNKSFCKQIKEDYGLVVYKKIWKYTQLDLKEKEN